MTRNRPAANAAREQQFVKAFVKAEHQQRAIFELGSRTTRSKFFSRLAHRYREVLAAETMTPVASYPAAEEAARILALLTGNAAESSTYFMSDHEEIDGIECSLSDGVMHVTQAVMPTVLVCGSALALFKAEQDAGAAPMFLLKRGA
jgi:hypothetical protein